MLSGALSANGHFIIVADVRCSLQHAIRMLLLLAEERKGTAFSQVGVEVATCLGLATNLVIVLEREFSKGF